MFNLKGNTMKRLLLATAIAAATFSPFALIPAYSLAAEAAAANAVDAYEVSNEQMIAWYEGGAFSKDIRVIDSRPAGRFAAGSIPGSINLPLDALKKDVPGTIERLAIPKTAIVVFYCAGRECTLSIDSAEIFRNSGYAQARVYRNGVPGWNQKMQPLLAAESFVKDGKLILIDTGVGKKTIVAPGIQTIQIQQFELGGKGKELLAELSRNAPLVVLERGNMKAVNEALEELRDQDFRRLTYLPIKDWKGSLAAAPALAKATWTPTYGPGQISPKEFEQAVARGEFTMDIRPKADFAAGHFKGAVNIPIEVFDTEWETIPKDRPVYFHCGTGTKAQKAFDILGRKGYTNLKYVDAEVSCKGDVCSIKE